MKENLFLYSEVVVSRSTYRRLKILNQISFIKIKKTLFKINGVVITKTIAKDIELKLNALLISFANNKQIKKIKKVNGKFFRKFSKIIF